ncbi:MAG: protein translocase subunit SecD [Alphaproteobacteria bacterium]|nr:protein translocase subunit SecD [Alphaproteobacteria bacterium]
MINLGRGQQGLIILLSLWALLYALPNILPNSALVWMQKMPSWFPQQAVSLGLDLRGGAHLLLAVQTEAVLNDALDTMVDDVRRRLRDAKIKYTDLRQASGTVSVIITESGQMEKAQQALADLRQEFNVISEDRRISLSFRKESALTRRQQALEQSIEIVRRRIDETGTREPTIQRQGDDRIMVQLPGVDDPSTFKRLLGQTAKLTFRLVDDTANPNDLAMGRAPAGFEALPDVEREGGYHAVNRRVMLGGDQLTSAAVSYQQGAPVVAFAFDSLGAKKFGEVTRNNVGKQFAIVLDNKVISAPVIREPILGGSGVISGNFTAESANELAILLRAGALPAPIQVIEERTVGPGLGADSVEAGRLSALAGLVLVLALMLGRYKLFGLFANIALLINIAMIFALLSVLGASLTLPGIAGIVLIIGTAVDANVLIFERIREEIRNGRTVFAALDAGYSNALSAVIDANVTNLIASVLLFALGSGPIKGFGITLSIGTLTSMFTAIMVTRLLVVWWVKATKPKQLFV